LAGGGAPPVQKSAEGGAAAARCGVGGQKNFSKTPDKISLFRSILKIF